MAYNYRDNYEDWDPKYNYNKDKTNYSGYNNNNYYYGKDYSSGYYNKNGNDLGSAVNKDDIDKLLNMGSGSVTTSITTTRTLRRQVIKGDHTDSYDDVIRQSTGPEPTLQGRPYTATIHKKEVTQSDANSTDSPMSNSSYSSISSSHPVTDRRYCY